MNGYNFTEDMRRTLALAREEAAALFHQYIGTEHELLGLLRAGDGVATVALTNLGVDLDGLRESVLSIVQRGRREDATGPDLPYTSRAKKVLELCMDEARTLGHSYCGTEHLLLGLIREEKGIGAKVLMEAGTSLDAARAEVLRILSGGAAASPSPRRILHASEWAGATAGSRPTPASVQRYSERLTAVLVAAHDIAKRTQSAELTSVHAAVALLEHRQGMANTALDVLRFDRNQAISSLETIAKSAETKPVTDGVLTLTGQMMEILKAVDTLNQARGSGPGTQHLLLNILQASPDVAQVFAQQNVTEEILRDTVNRVSG